MLLNIQPPSGFNSSRRDGAAQMGRVYNERVEEGYREK